MDIAVRNHQESHILDVNGELDLYNAYRLQEAVRAILEAGGRGVVLNLKGVRFIDSSGVASLLSVNAMLAGGHTLRICNISRAVQRVFDLTRLSLFLPIVASEPDALESINAARKSDPLVLP